MDQWSGKSRDLRFIRLNSPKSKYIGCWKRPVVPESIHETRIDTLCVGAAGAMQIEVGPTAQGLLRHDVVDATSAAVAHVLAFVELFNAKLDPPRRGVSTRDSRVARVVFESSYFEVSSFLSLRRGHDRECSEERERESQGSPARAFELSIIPKSLSRDSSRTHTLCQNSKQGMPRFDTVVGGRPLPTRVEAFTTAGSHAKISWPVDDRGFPTAITHKHLQATTASRAADLTPSQKDPKLSLSLSLSLKSRDFLGALARAQAGPRLGASAARRRALVHARGRDGILRARRRRGRLPHLRQRSGLLLRLQRTRDRLHQANRPHAVLSKTPSPLPTLSFRSLF